MLRINERKFPISLEVGNLVKKLREENRMKDFEEEILKTGQGQAIKRNVVARNQKIVRWAIEKRPEDNSEQLYITVKFVV